MELKILKGTNNVGRDLLEISTNKTKIVVGFGEEIATGDIAENINPMIEGLTFGNAEYDGVFILRNPENSNIIKYMLKEIPLYMEKKLRFNYEICSDFLKQSKRDNICDIEDAKTFKIGDLEITSFVVDTSNYNTQMLQVKYENKCIVVSGDFKNHDIYIEKDKLEKYLGIIRRADYLIVEGKYLGKHGIEYASKKDTLEKLKNIMKFYKQVLVVQSETDMLTASNMYEAAKKTKKIFIENTFLSNVTSIANGSTPNPVTGKNTFSYNAIMYEKENFDFRKKYVAPFYIHNANNKMKKEKYLLNITTEMLEDVYVLNREEKIYDTCIILALWKGYLQKNRKLESFLTELKNMDMDYYEVYTRGRINLDVINKMIVIFEPINVIPLDYNPKENTDEKLYNFKYVKEGEVINV